MTDAVGTSRILTLVFTDLADSMALKLQRGDRPVSELITRHRSHTRQLAAEAAGRIIDWAGDGCFLTFETPSAAVLFALRLQQAHSQETDLPLVRVGIHMGEVSERIGPDGDAARPRIEGLAVDLAARICALARPAQVLMSPAVADSARQRLDLNTFAQPIRWQSHGGYAVKGFDGAVEIREAGLEGVARFVAPLPSLPTTTTAPQDAPTPSPPVRKNSICVLPFVNMSGDAEQEYFSDGISEDIITDLSKVSALFVIARNTAFTFKAKSVDVPQVARQLNVSHVLEGSVRKAGGRVRITAQLIDGATGGHLWAERYDRELTDIFALQDEIAEAIVKALKLKLLPEEKQQIERRGTSNLEAYDLYLRGTRPAFAPEEVRTSIALLEAATRLAPDYADAWGALALTRAIWRFSRPNVERAEIAAAVTAEAERAIALEPQNAAAIRAQFWLLPPFGRYADAEALAVRLENSVSSRQVDSLIRILHAESVGRIREAIEAAERLHEIDPLNPFVLNLRGQTLLFGGRYAEAREILEGTLARWPDSHGTALNLIMVCVHTQDWAAVDALLSPERLARFPLREFDRVAHALAGVMRDPSPQSSRRIIEAVRRRFDASGHADFGELQLAAQRGASDEAHAIAAQARFGPAGDERDQMGADAYRTYGLFMSMFPELRRDPRFVKLCARLGLVDYWLTTQHWPDCVDEVAPYYDFKAECEKVAAGPVLPPANEAGSKSTAA